MRSSARRAATIVVALFLAVACGNGNTKSAPSPASVSTPTTTLSAEDTSSEGASAQQGSASEGAPDADAGSRQEPDEGPSASPSLAPGVGEAAEALVQDFLTDLRHGDLEAAAGRWTGYPYLAPSSTVIDRVPSIEALLSNPVFASILDADIETFVNASSGWTTASPVVTVLAGVAEGRPAVAAGFLVGLSDEQGEPGQMWIHRFPTADIQSGEIQSIVEPGGQVTLSGVPVEGGARAYLNETEIEVVVDHSNLTTTINVPEAAEGTVTITLSTATPELSAVQAFVLTIISRYSRSCVGGA